MFRDPAVGENQETSPIGWDLERYMISSSLRFKVMVVLITFRRALLTTQRASKSGSRPSVVELVTSGRAIAMVSMVRTSAFNLPL
jgi:hypothetical protein